VHPPLRVELANEAHAEELRLQLQPFDVETVRVDNHVEVQIALLSFNPESKIVAALNAIEAWLPTSGLSAVRVHLDGSSYMIHPPAKTGKAT
jgi:hypothetical protein